MTEASDIWICLACGRRYNPCPDHDAHECPVCGEKVAPLRIGFRYEAKCHEGCDEELHRADGGCICEICKKEYRYHPGCYQTRDFERHLGRSYYHTKVLCDGRHVHL